MEEPIPDSLKNLQEKIAQLEQEKANLVDKHTKDLQHQKELLAIHEKYIVQEKKQKPHQLQYIAAFVGIVTLFFLYQQNKLVEGQNTLVEKQNEYVQVQTEKAEQQSYLAESARRAALVAEMTEIMNKIDEELDDQDKKGKNSRHTLSSRLIGRIVGLSRNLKPYKYLDNNGCLTELLSPERGQLLLNLVNADIDTTSLTDIYKKADFSYADLQEVVLDSTHFLVEADLRRANLQGADLEDANLQGADLRWANLQGTDLYSANLQGADLRSANLQGADLRSANLQGTELWYANLQGADLRSANLQGTDLRRANLQGTELWYANLQGADLRSANLQGASLISANLEEADLRWANLQEVKVASKTWFNDLRKLTKPPNGLEALMKKYKVDTSKVYKDVFLGEYYKIIER